MKLKLVDDVVKKFIMSKLFGEDEYKVTTINFSADGKLLVSCDEDDQIRIFDTEKGTEINTVSCRKYGVDQVHFTHSTANVVHSSTKVDNNVRYLSLYDNKYIRYFIGHTEKVTVVSMSPKDDTFLSGGIDNKVMLWDTRSTNTQGLISLSGRPVISYDPDGVCFAVGINSGTIKLYDLRSFDKAPFNVFKIGPDEDCGWTCIKFSPDGKLLLVGTNGTKVHVVDAFTGHLIHTLTGFINSTKLGIEASFSPDSEYIFAGSGNGVIHVWKAETGAKLCELKGEHRGTVHCVKFNPTAMQLASASCKVGFWLPDIETDD